MPLALSLENTQVDNRTTLQDQPRSSEEELKKELEGMGGSTTPRVSSAVSTTISTRISRNLLLLVCLILPWYLLVVPVWLILVFPSSASLRVAQRFRGLLSVASGDCRTPL